MFSLTLAAVSLLSAVLAYNSPPLDYAFTITSTSQAVGSPVTLFGYNQTAGISINSTISGPLLNASLASLSFAEQIYAGTAGTNVTYSASQASGIYVTDDGESFFYTQTGVANAKSDVAQTVLRGIGGKYAHLQQYLFVCYTPITTGSSFNNTAPTSSSSSSSSASTTSSSAPGPVQTALNEPANTASADCFAVGGL